MFIDACDDFNAERFGFVADGLAEFAMAPLADFLLRLLVQPFAGADVAHVAEGDGVCLFLDGHLDDFVAGLVEHIACPTLLFGQKAVDALLHLTGPVAAVRATGEPRRVLDGQRFANWRSALVRRELA